ncbi:MAG: multicopper oxidase domain-containing protein [Actinomycetota bacterium]
MRRFRTGGLVLATLLALVAVACSGGEGGDAPAAGDGEAAAAGGPVTVDVMLSDFKIEPATLEVPAGSDITFNVMNHGQAPHTFGVVVDGQTIETPSIDVDGSASLEVPALAAGTYDTLCTVPGHDQLGMVGTLTATDGTAAAGGDPLGAGDTATTDHATMTAEEMAAGHEQGVKDFLAGKETDTAGNQPLEPEIDGKVKVFNLTVEEIQWEVAKGQFVDAMAFNGMVPGPEIRVSPRDHVRFVVQNQMTEPFVLHFHGLTVPNSEDGVPYVTQPPIMPGEYWTYEFTIEDPPGMYVYHSHFNSAEQVGKGLYGALIVEPRSGKWATVYDAEPAVETSMFVGDGPLGYNLNGKSFPATAPIVADEGEWVLVHMANDGSLLHPMHLHGFHFMVMGVDGFPLDPEDRYMADTLVVAPGSRFDIMVKADYPGAWAFHCHILPHAEGPDGMFGMVTALVVQ